MGRLLRLPRFRVAYPLRGVAAWIGIRLAAALVGITAPDLLQIALILGAVGLAVWLDDVEDLFTVADEVIWVTAGTSHWLGPPAAASRHGQFRREYLGPGRGVVPQPGPGGDT